VRESTSTYMKAQRSNYVRACRTEVHRSGLRTRLTQVWWLENEIQAVRHTPPLFLRGRSAHSALQEAMSDMADVKAHQFALLAHWHRMGNR
jgi:hypothetical protein